MSDDMLVRLINVTKRLWGYPVLIGVNLDGLRRDFIAIINPEGNYMLGKTVLLEIIAGLMRADYGSVIVLGVDLMKEFGMAFKLRRRDLIIIPRNPSTTLIMTLTNLENIMLPLLQLGMKKNEARALALDTAKSLGLSEDVLRKTTGKASLKERKLITIARALALRPKVLIIDEPIISNDAEATEMILINLWNFVNNNEAVVIAAHDKAAIPHANKQYALINGRLVPH